MSRVLKSKKKKKKKKQANKQKSEKPIDSKTKFKTTKQSEGVLPHNQVFKKTDRETNIRMYLCISNLHRL